MHYRRLASLLVGAWLSGSLLMMVVATQNFRGVDRLLAAPSTAAAPLLKALDGNARPLLRYQASELNRWYFRAWERMQLVFAPLLLAVLFFWAEARPPLLLLTGLIFVLTAAQHWLLTPEIIRLGRNIDFVPAQVFTPDRGRFWGLHTTYSLIETVKLALGVVVAGMLLRKKRRLARAEDRDAPLDPAPLP
ncbi:MAG: hypothetical protein RMK57_14690 [Bryobacterales bacterium]|nr:hypothetical protein [Bryobacteraceae bacterium]MDW8355768.1 hypothetical protein [Bryobacterales bacterium]